MKKIIAILLAVVMVLGCGVMAFAESAKKCPYCSGVFYDSDIYNEHIAICYDQANGQVDKEGNILQETQFNIGDLSLSDTINNFIEIFDISAAWWDAIEDIVVRLLEFAENFTTLFVEFGDAIEAKN